MAFQSKIFRLCLNVCFTCKLVSAAKKNVDKIITAQMSKNINISRRDSASSVKLDKK